MCEKKSCREGKRSPLELGLIIRLAWESEGGISENTACRVGEIYWKKEIQLGRCSCELN